MDIIFLSCKLAVLAMYTCIIKLFLRLNTVHRLISYLAVQTPESYFDCISHRLVPHTLYLCNSMWFRTLSLIMLTLNFYHVLFSLYEEFQKYLFRCSIVRTLVGQSSLARTIIEEHISKNKYVRVWLHNTTRQTDVWKKLTYVTYSARTNWIFTTLIIPTYRGTYHACFPINNSVRVRVGMYVLENELFHGELSGLFISSLIYL
jgi:hypothetical protein